MIRPEDESRINEMTYAFRLSKEAACILLVAFNDELHRRDVEAELKRRLEPEGFNFREFPVTEDGYKNIPVMLVNMKPQPEDIFLIYDLKNALPEALEYLNYRREDFVEHNISAIFWLDEPTLTQISRKALDFFAFRSLPVFEFHIDRSRETVIPGRTTLSEIYMYSSLEELNEKIALREEILEDYLEKRPEDHSTIANLHGEIGNLYNSKSQFDEAMAHYGEALAAHREITDRRGEAGDLGNMGLVYSSQGELNKALEYHSQALKIHRKIGDVQGEANDLGNIGLMYSSKGDLNKALEYHSQALKIHHRIGDVQGEAIQLGNVGLIYDAQGELDKALEYHSQALEIDREIGYIKGEASVLGNIGLVYSNKGDLDKATEYYSQALEIRRRIGDVQGEATALGNMGVVYFSQGNLDKAMECYSQSLEINRRIGDVQGEANALNNMGVVYSAQGGLGKALDYTRNALRIFVSIGAAPYADMTYGNLQRTMKQMESAGMEISEEDRKEIAELVEEYRKLKGESDGGGVG